MNLLLLKFLDYFCGNCNLLVDKLSLTNRHTRRIAAQNMVRLGLAEDGFYISPKISPLLKGDDGTLHRRAISDKTEQRAPKSKGFVQKLKDKFKTKKRPLEIDWKGLEQLEQRVLLSASNGTEVLQDAAQTSTAIEISYSISDLLEDDSQTLLEQVEAIQTHSIAIIDAGVEGAQTIVDALPEGTDVFYLTDDEDGVEQISEILSGYTGLDSVHIISHGYDGAINLGSSQLNTENYFLYANELSQWSSALSEDADILIYGCNVAESAAGQELIAGIAELTGADIAASDDLTGKGGDWDLEYESGNIEVSNINPDYNYGLGFQNTSTTGGISTVTVTEDAGILPINMTFSTGYTLTSVDFTNTSIPQGSLSFTPIGPGQGSFDYSPSGDFNYMATGTTRSLGIKYSAQNGSNTISETLLVTIQGINDDPTGIDDSYNINNLNTTSVTISESWTTAYMVYASGSQTGTGTKSNTSILLKDTDVDGDTLSLYGLIDGSSTVTNSSTITATNGGSVRLSSGNILYIPPTSTTITTDNFAYVLSDGNGATDTAKITIDFNTRPVANNETVSINESSATGTITNTIVGNLTDNDNDADFEPLVITQVDGNPMSGTSTTSTGKFGVLSVNIDGSYRYLLNDNDTGVDYLNDFSNLTESFTYIISDGHGSLGTDSATLGIIINGVNDSPVAENDDLHIYNDQYFRANIFADNGSGPDGDPEFAYGLELFQYTNTAGSPSTATFNTEAFSTTGTLESGANLRAERSGWIDYNSNDVFDSLTGTTSESISYLIRDFGGSTTLTATATANITVHERNDIQVNETDTSAQFALLYKTDFAKYDYGINSETFTNSITSETASTAEGMATYTWSTDYQYLGVSETETQTFTYLARGSNGFSSTGEFPRSSDTSSQYAMGQVMIVINGVNDGPNANDESYFEISSETLLYPELIIDEEDAITTFNVLSNDSDTDINDVLSVDSSSYNVTSAKGMNVTMTSSGLFTYDAAGSFDYLDTRSSTTDSFTYMITDGNGGTDTATVTILINGLNDDPNAVDDTLFLYGMPTSTTTTGRSGSTLTTTHYLVSVPGILSNDTDVDASDSANFTGILSGTATTNTITTARGGTLINGGGANLRYTPPLTSTSTDNFQYQVTDGNGGVDIATATITFISFDYIVINDFSDIPDGDIFDGDISLRDAFMFANDGALITFANSLMGETLTLNPLYGEFFFNKSINIIGDIDGDGVADITIDANGVDRIFRFTGDTSYVNGIRMINGSATQGGAILATGDLIIENSVFESNSADNFGGALFFDQGTLDISNSEFINNDAEFGGAIVAFNATVNLNELTIDGNTSGESGAGILVSNSILNISNSTLSNNVSDEFGGAIVIAESVLNLFQSTLSGNEALKGGAIESSLSEMNITHSTIAYNKADEGSAIRFFQLDQSLNTLNMSHTIISDNTNAIESIAGDLDSSSFNLFDEAVVSGSTGSDILNGVAELLALGYNGGPTRTHAIGAGSGARDSGDIAGVFVDLDGATNDYDQRRIGYNRILNGQIDRGAVENLESYLGNDAPDAVNNFYAIDEDGAIVASNILLNDSDPDLHAFFLSELNGSVANVGGLELLASGAE
ncbi:MAG: DUF4347 domain-containing protein, partial [Lentisphaeria bacterium]|nr:DUF4347 domain-containing protein [Lentisphaeria bacterium]NQZ70950.1 DUF4347 domain-containing protein [Lentisphaeria bacterium]